MSGTAEAVVRMANDIARNFAAHGEEQAVEETANHIRLFWDPRMKTMALARLDEPDCGLSSIARAALSRISATTSNG